MAEVADIDKARAERFAAELLGAFVVYGALVARTEDVGDPELWRGTAMPLSRRQRGLWASESHPYTRVHSGVGQQAPTACTSPASAERRLGCHPNQTP
jgi:hypothetical protein